MSDLAQTNIASVSILLLCLLLSLLAKIIHAICFHPLRRIPGPILAGYTELWRTRRYFRGTWHDDILDLHRRYGSVVRIAPNEVSFVSKDALTQLYGHKSSMRKTSWYDVWSLPDMGSGIFETRDSKLHSFLRKRVSAPYSMSNILTLEKDLQPLAEQTWTQFRRMARAGEAIDFQRWTNFFAEDVVCQLGVGEPLGFVKTGGDIQGLMRSIHRLFYAASCVGNLPGQNRWLILFGTTILSKFGAWCGKQIRTRMVASDGPGNGRKSDFLDHFMSMKKENGDPASYPEVAIEFGNLIGAGGDTTAIGIATVIAQLMLHPDDMRRAQDEVDDAVREGQDLEYATTSKLPFLNACIKEATRLHPSILWQLPRETPSQGITIDGYHIPHGMIVSMSPIAQNRCIEVFGEDADRWRPERYLISDTEYLRSIEKYNVTFGYGSRTCIGRNLAIVEIHKFVSQFIRHFDVHFADSTKPLAKRSHWFCLLENMKVRLHERVHEEQIT